MIPNFYGNKTIENVTIALLDMFNDVYVQVLTSAGDEVQNYRVPITVGPRSKLYDIRKEGYTSEGGTKYYLQLPRMALSFPSLSYDQNRACATNNIRYFYATELEVQDMDTFITDIQPTPYNFEYTLSIRTNTMTEWTQIVEQFLPFFNPAAYIRIRELSSINIERDLKVSIGSVSPVFENDPQSETTKRSIICDISLTVEGWLYGSQDTFKIIKYIDSKYYIDQSSELGTSAVDVSYYSTSGIGVTSAGKPITSAIPDSSVYSFSGESENSNLYWFTSATNYDI